MEDSHGRDIFTWAQDDAGTICASDDDARMIAASRTVIPALLDALDAALDLHKPIRASMTTNSGVSDTTVCAHCLDPAWPCQTVARIEAKMKGVSDALA